MSPERTGTASPSHGVKLLMQVEFEAFGDGFGVGRGFDGEDHGDVVAGGEFRVVEASGVFHAANGLIDGEAGGGEVRVFRAVDTAKPASVGSAGFAEGWLSWAEAQSWAAASWAAAYALVASWTRAVPLYSLPIFSTRPRVTRFWSFS